MKKVKRKQRNFPSTTTEDGDFSCKYSADCSEKDHGCPENIQHNE